MNDSATIGDLMYSIGAEWDDDALNNIRSGLDTVSKGVLSLLATLGTAAVGSFAFVQHFAAFNDELGKLSRNRDVSIETIQAIQYGLESAGVSADQASSMLSKTHEQMQKFKDGKADYYKFSQLGIDPNAYKTNEEFFLGIVDGLKNVKNEALKADLAREFLGSDEILNFVDAGSAAILAKRKEMQEMGILITNEDYEASAKLNDLWLELTTNLKGMMNKIAVSIIPTFNKMLEKFIAFMQVNKDIIKTKLKDFLSALILTLQFFMDLILRVSGHLGGFENILMGIAIAFGLWQAPLLLAIAGVAALLIAFDDLMNFMDGKDSVIGDIIQSISDKLDEFKSAFPNVAGVIEASIDSVIAIFVYFKNYIFKLWDLIIGKIDFVTFISGQMEELEKLLTQLADSFLKAFDHIGDAISEKLQNIPFLDKLFGNSSVTVNQQSSQALKDVPVSIPSNPNNPTNQTYYYNINANIDAKNKTISQSLKEIQTPAFR